MLKNKHFRKIKHFAIGSLSCVAVLALCGCDVNQNHSQAQNIQKGAVVILEQQPNGKYKILEEYPAASTHVIVRSADGSERVLSKDEINDLIKQEELKIDSGKSELLSDGSSQGLGLGGAILASAAGAILGSYIGNKLFNNPAFNQNSQRNYKSPQAYERSKNSFSNSNLNRSNSTGRSGFFNSQSKSNSFSG